jgi:regulator of sigma E protease
VAGPALVRRGGEEVSIDLPRVSADAPGHPGIAEGLDAGPDEGAWVSPMPVYGDTSPMAAAGMAPGSRILRLDEHAIESFLDLGPLVSGAGRAGASLRVTWREPDGTDVGPVEVRPAQGFGVRPPDGLQIRMVTAEVRGDDILDSVRRGVVHTHRTVMHIFATLGSLLSADVSPRNLAGPVAIANFAYRTAQRSWGDFYLFLGMISMNLAVLNILPIPLLDGGQLMVITAEKVRGEPLPESILAGIQWAGLVFLLGLMVFVITNDIVNLS